MRVLLPKLYLLSLTILLNCLCQGPWVVHLRGEMHQVTGDYMRALRKDMDMKNTEITYSIETELNTKNLKRVKQHSDKTIIVFP